MAAVDCYEGCCLGAGEGGFDLLGGGWWLGRWEGLGWGGHGEMNFGGW